MAHNFPQGYDYITINEELTKNELKNIAKLSIDCDINLQTIDTFLETRSMHKYVSFARQKIVKVNTIDEDDFVITKDEFINFMKGIGEEVFNETLILSDKYSARVTKSSIKVGCQYFTHETLDKLHELSLKARNLPKRGSICT